MRSPILGASLSSAVANATAKPRSTWLMLYRLPRLLPQMFYGHVFADETSFLSGTAATKFLYQTAKCITKHFEYAA
jgi:hypothetical protein